MPARKSPPERPRKSSGASIEEWQRRGCKVQYRLTEREAEMLSELARNANTSPNLYALRVMRERLGPPSPVRDSLEAWREERDDLAELRADMHPEE